jgi:hypothetical protein
MSETAVNTGRPFPLTEEEFKEVMAADEMILKLLANNLLRTLYSYNQAKQLLSYVSIYHSQVE